MAQLKSTVVQGSLRVTDTTYGNQVKISDKIVTPEIYSTGDVYIRTSWDGGNTKTTVAKFSGAQLLPGTSDTDRSIGSSSASWPNVYATTFHGSLTGNADTATSASKWTTARTLTIGNKGQSVNGSANVSWGLQDILIRADNEFNFTADGMESIHFNHKTQSGTNATTAIKNYYFKNGSGGTTGVTIYAATFSGALSGNATTATTATKLANAPTLASGGTPTVGLSANTAYTLTVGGQTLVFRTPVDSNTDTKVAFSAATDNAEYPILLKNSTGSTTTTAGTKFANTSGKMTTINPSTGTITAPVFKGALTGNVTGNVSGSSGSCTGNAATATADTEGRNFIDVYAKEYVQTIDLTGDDITKWYPVTIQIPYVGLRRISCVTELNSGHKPSWSSHSSGYTAVVEMLVTASGWGTTNSLSICLTDDQVHLNADEPKPVGFSQFGFSSRATFWCRGGAKYKLLTDFFGTWTVYKTDTTVSSQTIGPKTANPGINFSKSTITANLNGNASMSTKWAAAQTAYVALGTASKTTSIQGGSSSAVALGVDGTLAVAHGGTGLTTSTYKNAVVVGNASTVTNAFHTIRTGNGAFYATATDGAPTFGTLPVAQGGTGKTTAADAWTALGGGASGKHADSYFRLNTAPASGAWFAGTPTINSSGVMEIGKYIDFHATNAATSDYDVRITASTTGLSITGTTTVNYLFVNRQASSGTEGGEIRLQKGASNTWDAIIDNQNDQIRFFGQKDDGTTPPAIPNVKISTGQFYGAVWNDYAEFRQATSTEPGRVVIENGDDTLILSTARLQSGAEIISDTFGFAIGKTDRAQTPIATSGRVLAYPYESREEFKANIGKPVCSGPNGTVSIMTQEEYEKYGYCAIGTISAVPDYEEWGSESVAVDGRVWIRVR